jgi:hypothetical protein
MNADGGLRRLERELARVEREEEELVAAGGHPTELLLKRAEAAALRRKLAEAALAVGDETPSTAAP